ncbi:MAG: glucose-6-phosphate dehydrogenase assembly protein OpcA [Verrucomicrobiota bacterium]
MSTATLDSATLSQLGQSVELSNIEEELQTLFTGDGETGKGSARASIINLAIYNENPADLADDAAVLAEVTGEAACRSLLICADPSSSESGVDAWVQAHCRIGRDGKETVCSEQVSFLLRGGSAAQLRNTVFAHLDSDLPLAFWWRGEFSDTFEARLYTRIDRLLFDSESWESPRNQLVRLISARERSKARFAMHDLAFTRINAIRQAVANAFDKPHARQETDRLREIEIRHKDSHRMSAIYLAAWIANRLRSELESNASTPDEFRFRSSEVGYPRKLKIRLQPMATKRRGMVEVDFHLPSSRIEIERCQTKDFYRTRHTSSDNYPEEENWLPAKSATNSLLVTDILTRAGRNRTHVELLPQVLKMLAL